MTGNSLVTIRSNEGGGKFAYQLLHQRYGIGGGAGQMSMLAGMFASGSVKQKGGLPVDMPIAVVPLLFAAVASSTVMPFALGTQPTNHSAFAPEAAAS